jgi:hypothetical protein
VYPHISCFFVPNTQERDFAEPERDAPFPLPSLLPEHSNDASRIHNPATRSTPQHHTVHTASLTSHNTTQHHAASRNITQHHAASPNITTSHNITQQHHTTTSHNNITQHHTTSRSAAILHKVRYSRTSLPIRSN